MQTYASELEKRQMQNFVQQRANNSQQNSADEVKKDQLLAHKPRDLTNMIPLPTSAEIMR